MTSPFNSPNTKLLPDYVTDLIWKSTTSGESLGVTDATPVTITGVDRRGREYILRFLVRNDHLADVQKALRLLTPIRKVRP